MVWTEKIEEISIFLFSYGDHTFKINQKGYEQTFYSFFLRTKVFI